MALYTIRNVSFSYPNCQNAALCDLSLSINEGEFITLCGSSGSGKTTLLRCLKPSLAPNGTFSGTIEYEGKNLSDIPERRSASEIGFVMQSPEKQLVTDKVYHELAFGAESLGVENGEMRARVAETASFFGIEDLFHKKTTELSGGEKQLVALASVMVLRPKVLLLDEPTSRLSPIAASDFLSALKKLNTELGTTIVLSEHCLEEAFPLSDRAIVLDGGKILCDDTPRGVGKLLKERGHKMFSSLPTALRTATYLCDERKMPSAPLSVREGKEFLQSFARDHTLLPERIPEDRAAEGETVLEAKEVFFRYEKDCPDVLSAFSMSVKRGEIFALLGGNGAGKSTAVSLFSGILRPVRGKILLEGKRFSDISSPYRGLLGVLPQEPLSLFAKTCVRDDLYDMLPSSLSEEQKKEKINKAARLCRIEPLLQNHPYDLSGGEIQRAALAMLLLREPSILLLDEPTKGMDGDFKRDFAALLYELKNSGKTILLVSHDTEFCAEVADRCALLFDGSILACAPPHRFFSANRFYTTAASRMAREILPRAVTVRDILLAAGKEIPKNASRADSEEQTCKRDNGEEDEESKAETEEEKKMGNTKKRSPTRLFFGVLFGVLFLLFFLFGKKLSLPRSDVALPMTQIALLFVFTACLFPPAKEKAEPILPTESEIESRSGNKTAAKRTGRFVLFTSLAVAATVLVGVYLLQDRKYFFTSMLILFELFFAFFLSFEKKKPTARYVVLMSSLCALTVAGRAAFFMLPQFKPVAALTILTGVCLGAESGFLMGAMSAFLSNFLFGQGSWTPWQMFAFGLIGAVSGLLRTRNLLPIGRTALSLYGFFVTLILYGGIMNPASVLMFTPQPNKKLILAAYVAGFPMDLIHAFSTAFFLWVLSRPMIEKIVRLRKKCGGFMVMGKNSA